ncbi:MAG: 2,3,4,5-tetrahydropyridine-2,6-dicarboxylate N-succinyltransferase, partial [Novosphingobium sp.]|nr:2,3,4,5-tetrahydropyridine-2,6-dicarboxylate N-succinyltransferase [Novosphingobium sp.]
MTAQLQAAIEAAWEDRANVTPASTAVREVVEAALELLDSGQVRVA